MYLNPDGHEWKRAKWSMPVRAYWKISEKVMVRNADLLVCDSQNIERYIVNNYSRYQPKTTFIAYGSETELPDFQMMTKYTLTGLEKKTDAQRILSGGWPFCSGKQF